MTPSTQGLPVQEERGPDRTIARLSTARTAFVGRTLRGPVNRPVLIKNFGEFQQTFGGLWQPSRLSYAVEHFFDNGGGEALIVRVVNGARAATLTLRAAGGAMTLEARSPGTREFLRASVDYDNIPADEERALQSHRSARAHRGRQSRRRSRDLFPALAGARGAIATLPTFSRNRNWFGSWDGCRRPGPIAPSTRRAGRGPPTSIPIRMATMGRR